MNAATIKKLAPLGTFIRGTLFLLQIAWVISVYQFANNQMGLDIRNSLRTVDEELAHQGLQVVHKADEVLRPKENVFVMGLSNPPAKDSILTLIVQGLQQTRVFTNCNIYYINEDLPLQNYQVAVNVQDSTAQYEPIQTNANYSMPYKSGFVIEFPKWKKFLLYEIRHMLFSTLLVFFLLLATRILYDFFFRIRSFHEHQKNFVNNFSHEFKTPLASLKIATEVIAEPNANENPERMKRYISIIAQQTKHLENQVERLLHMNNVGGAGLQIVTEPVNMNALIVDVMEKLDPIIQNKQANVKLELSDKYAMVQGDATYLSQVLYNLIENGLKYSTEKPDLSISSGANEEKTGYCFAVKDHGIGISKEHLDLIFSKYYRVPTGDQHNFKGFGIGLYFVKQIVEAHKGKVTVQSIPGVGTQFSICLPFSNNENVRQKQSIDG
jgi:two-component system, OmpR family, phosphate regulon sensor histidine kinase PhoR